MKPIVPILLLFTISLTACTNLNVKVEIFDPSGITSDDALESTVKRQAVNHSYLLKTDFYPRTSSDLRDQVTHFLASLASAQCPDHSKVIADGDLPQLSSKARTKIESTITQAIHLRNDGLIAQQEAETMQHDYAAAQQGKRRDKLSHALDSFAAATKLLGELGKDFQQSFDNKTKDLILCLEKEPTVPNLDKLHAIISTQKHTQASMQNELVSLTGGANIMDDPLAPAVIAAPNAFWKGIYNETTALGTMGNTDIAIKMETVGSFTIKGVRVDTSKVTEATFDVLKQSIRMVAAAYGVPLPITGSKTQQGTGESPTDVLATTDEIRLTADRKRLLSKTAVLTLLDLIVAQRTDLRSASNRKVTIQSLKHSFEAYKGQLIGN